jgi:hypothetical protein
MPMPMLSTRAVPLLLLAAMVLGACGDQANPTGPTPEDPNRIITCGPGCGGGGGGGGPPPPPPLQPPVVTSITMEPTVALSSWSAYDVGFNGQFGTGAVNLTNVSIDATVIQGSASRSVGSQLIVCGSGFPAGRLPANATCSMPGIFFFLNNAAPGPGTLVPGAAIFRVSLRQGATLLGFLDRSVWVTSPGPVFYPGFTRSTNTPQSGSATLQ